MRLEILEGIQKVNRKAISNAQKVTSLFNTLSRLVQYTDIKCLYANTVKFILNKILQNMAYQAEIIDYA